MRGLCPRAARSAAVQRRFGVPSALKDLGLRFLLLNGVFPRGQRTPWPGATDVTAHKNAAPLRGVAEPDRGTSDPRRASVMESWMAICLDGWANSCCAGECNSPEAVAPSCSEGTSSN
ncbi:hypothetical protein CP877_07740 [Cutibacterium modestum]|nr:hypothetical protein CP877_07740 [Cutibacterium modestum]